MDSNKKDIPKSWKWIALRNIGIIVTGNTPSTKVLEYYQSNDISFFKPSDLEQGINTIISKQYLSKEAENVARIVPSNSVLVTCIGATIGKTGLLSRAGAFNQQINGIIPFINPKYLYYYCITSEFQNELSIKSSSTTIPILNKSKFETIKVPIAPLNEQNRIVEKIEELFSELDSVLLIFETLKVKLKVYWLSEINSFFRGNKKYTILSKGTTQPQKKLEEIDEKRIVSGKKYTGKNDTDNKNVINYDLPHHWRLVKLSDLYIDPVDSITDGPFGSNLKSDDFQEFGFPVFKIQNIDRNKFLSKDITYVSEEKFNQLEKHQFKNGDIVITKLGSPLGKACIVPNNFDKGVIVADLIRIKESEYINSKFLMYSLNSPYIISQIEKLSKGTTRQRVTLRDIRNLVIIFPSIEEQELIVNNIEELDDEINGLSEIINQSCLNVLALKQKILEDAFSGSLINKEIYEENIEDYLGQILIKKEEYLIKLKEQQKSIVKTRKINVNMDLLEILEKEENPISSHTLWQKSIYKNDIEEFYKKLKELESKIRELKEGYLSYIELIK